jgi:hypothetical protein
MTCPVYLPEVLSFQKVNEVAAVQMLLDLQNISHGDPTDADRIPPKPGKLKGDLPHNDYGDIASIRWSKEELDKKKKSFFGSESKEGSRRAMKEAALLMEYFAAYPDRGLDAFRRPGNQRIDTHHFNYSEQAIENALVKHLESPTTPSGRAYMDTLAMLAPDGKKQLQYFKTGWEKRLQQRKTPEGLSDLLVEFYDSYGRVPEMNNGYEEKKIFYELRKAEENIAFWENIYEKAGGEADFEIPYRLSKFLGADQRWKSPSDVAHWMDQFFHREKRLPSLEGGKFERALALAFREHSREIAAHFKNNELTEFHLEKERVETERLRADAEEAELIAHLEAEQLAALEQQASELKAQRESEEKVRRERAIPVFEDRLRDKIISALKAKPGSGAEKEARALLLRKYQNQDPEGILDPANLRRVLGEPGLPLGVDANEVDVVFTNTSTKQNSARQVLADIYVGAAGKKGFKVTKVGEDKNGVVYKFKGRGVSQYFLDSAGVSHRLSFKENGGIFTNDVLLKVRPKSGDEIAPLRGAPQLKWRLEAVPHQVTDPRLAAKIVFSENAWDTLRVWQTNVWLKKIEEHLNKKP